MARLGFCLIPKPHLRCCRGLEYREAEFLSKRKMGQITRKSTQRPLLIELVEHGEVSKELKRS